MGPREFCIVPRGAALTTTPRVGGLEPMRDWFFSDMSWLFFATWSVIVAAVGYAAFRRDPVPSKALGRNDASRISPPDSHF